MTTVAAPVIRNDADLATALQRVETLWGAEIGSSSGDELDVLITLVRDYESRHHRMDPPTPIEAIRGLMDRRGVANSDLFPIFGSEAKLSEFLAGKKPLSKAQVKALHIAYGIPYESLMG